MLKNNKYKKASFALLTIVFSLLLTACTPEQNIRGVPATTWQQLTPEQKQIIIEQSYQHDIENPST
jgi:outer membrane biogenesis lipoprotein LolB